MKIIFLPEVLEYFNELSTILYEEDYFGLKEDIQNYVENLLHDIEKSLDTCIQKPAPLHTLTRKPISLLIKLSSIQQ